MKTIGIIAEFNPFHRGHKHLIDEAKRLTQADFCIALMSGNFVQRGSPALINKYLRTRMALLNGIDLVIELPVVYATGSAEYFSRGAVRLFDKLGVVDFLCFGSECGEIEILKKTAAQFSDESPAFQKNLQTQLKKGLSFPHARSLAIDSPSQSSCENKSLPITSSLTAALANASLANASLATAPNNILAIEYLKALSFFDSKIDPVTIKRKGAGYHDEQAASASILRKLLSNELPGELPSELPSGLNNPKLEKGMPGELPSGCPSWNELVPENTLPLYDYNGETSFCDINSFSDLLYYKLTLNADSGYTQFFDVSKDLSDKIRKNLAAYSGYESFIHALKSKDLTYLRISRCLNHILLDIFKNDVTLFIDNDYVFYARMLGFRESAGTLLKAIKANSALPLLSKLADAEKLLDKVGLKMLKKDIQAAHIYDRTINEYTAPIIKH
ncbi:MAG: nucleotidyltransferase family protein [Lachnospiraceae bacterium]|nr:nucleotidyltransferase family protein [Lachnospiraceae bacterium]